MTSATQPIDLNMAPAQTPDNKTLSVVVLAAGQGKRMKSALPKVLHPLAGKPMLAHVFAAAAQLFPDKIYVVYGHGGEAVRAAFMDQPLVWIKQDPQLGTGHAVLQALPQLPSAGITLVLYGDVPLIRASTLAKLVAVAHQNTLAWLTMTVANPEGLGRILRNHQRQADDAGKGQVIGIIEDKDATDAERTIHEINTGFLACPTVLLKKWLPQLDNRNAQGEYYLTDILALAVAEGCAVQTLSPHAEFEIAGVNSKEQLAQLERVFQREKAEHLMSAGVLLIDPARLDVRGELTTAEDVTIDVNCIFEGTVHLDARTKIGANCILRNCKIGAGTEILPFSFIDGAEIGQHARIGPYARIRPDTTLADGVHIGNFVEIKASSVGTGSKANHLSYVGDATVGENVNIGAGTITCNYDGANKHRTVIQDNVHIGSDVQLVAPVVVGKGATIAAGTTVWKDAAAGELTLNPKIQATRPDWTRPIKTPRIVI